eukprot:TRINITY_DN37032_c0_g1_i1.p1 TRINITY_DN37032_c0_g1~~TRINITY_DN37032_c0_g1_i1.p1  ORF type:complete len:1375 (+),score=247.28 TRINITY_DN37032_c0_g1_i1:84-4208(+)
MSSEQLLGVYSPLSNEEKQQREVQKPFSAVSSGQGNDVAVWQSRFRALTLQDDFPKLDNHRKLMLEMCDELRGILEQFQGVGFVWSLLVVERKGSLNLAVGTKVGLQIVDLETLEQQRSFNDFGEVKRLQKFEIKGSLKVAAGTFGKLYIIDVETLECQKSFGHPFDRGTWLISPTDGWLHLVESKGSLKLAVGTIELWIVDVETLEEQKGFPDTHFFNCSQLVESKGRLKLVAGCGDKGVGGIHMVDIETLTKEKSLGGLGQILCLQVFEIKGSRKLAAGGADSDAIHIIDIETWEKQKTLNNNCRGCISFLQVVEIRDIKVLAAVTQSAGLQVFDLQTLELKKSFDVFGKITYLRVVEIKGQLKFALGTKLSCLHLVDVGTLKQQKSFENFGGDINCLDVVESSGSLKLAVGTDKGFHLLDLGPLLTQHAFDDFEHIKCFQVVESLGSFKLVAGTDPPQNFLQKQPREGSLHVVDLETLETKKSFNDFGSIKCLQVFEINGSHKVAAGTRSGLHIVDLETLEKHESFNTFENVTFLRVFEIRGRLKLAVTTGTAGPESFLIGQPYGLHIIDVAERLEQQQCLDDVVFSDFGEISCLQVVESQGSVILAAREKSYMVDVGTLDKSQILQDLGSIICIQVFETKGRPKVAVASRDLTHGKCKGLYILDLETWEHLVRFDLGEIDFLQVVSVKGNLKLAAGCFTRMSTRKSTHLHIIDVETLERQKVFDDIEARCLQVVEIKGSLKIFVGGGGGLDIIDIETWEKQRSFDDYGAIKYLQAMESQRGWTIGVYSPKWSGGCPLSVSTVDTWFLENLSLRSLFLTSQSVFPKGHCDLYFMIWGVDSIVVPRPCGTDVTTVLSRDMFGQSQLMLALSVAADAKKPVLEPLQKALQRLLAEKEPTMFIDPINRAQLRFAFLWALDGNWPALGLEPNQLLYLITGDPSPSWKSTAFKLQEGCSLAYAPSFLPGLSNWNQELLGIRGEPKVPVSADVCVVYGADELCNSMLFFSLLRECPKTLLLSPPIQALVLYTWDHHSKASSVSHMVYYFAALAAWVTFIMGIHDDAATFVAVAPAVLFLYDACILIKLRWEGIKIQDPWTWLQLLTTLFMAVSAAAHQWEMCQHIFDFLNPIIGLAAWFSSISYMRAFSSTSKYVGMLLETLLDISGFIVIIALCMLAFAQLFWTVDTVHSLPNLLEITYLTFLLGAFDIESDFGHGGIVMRCGFYALSVVGTLAVSNILIAIIGDTYERIIDRQDLELVLNRITLIIKFHGFTRASFPPFLVVASPSSGTTDGWQGRMAEMRKNLSNELEKTKVGMEESIRRSQESMEHKFASIQRSQESMEEKFESIQSSQKSMEAKLHDLDSKLEKLLQQTATG